MSEVVVTKATDVSSTKMLNEAYQGEGQKVQIDFCKTDKGKLEVYLTLNLENCMISGYSVSGGGDRPSESLSLNFTKIEFKNTGMGAARATPARPIPSPTTLPGHGQGGLTGGPLAIRTRAGGKPGPGSANPDVSLRHASILPRRLSGPVAAPQHLDVRLFHVSGERRCIAG